MKNLLLGYDRQVSEWAFKVFGYQPISCDLAVGILDGGRIVGAALFHAYNGHDVEISYYGPKTMTLGVVRKIAKLAVEGLGVSRITVRTLKSNKQMTQGIKGIGFQFECVRKNGYGEKDAIMYGLYGEKLAKLAGKAVH